MKDQLHETDKFTTDFIAASWKGDHAALREVLSRRFRTACCGKEVNGIDCVTKTHDLACPHCGDEWMKRLPDTKRRIYIVENSEKEIHGVPPEQQLGPKEKCRNKKLRWKIW